MIQFMQWAISFTVAVACLFIHSLAAAQLPSALVLEKKGNTTPEVQPYTEVSAGRTITLSSKSKIIFQHYYSCRTVTVVGGAVEFEAKAYFVKGGKKESETKSPCPKTVTLKAGGEAGGVLMRSMLSRIELTFSIRPEFVLVGKRANEFMSVHVSREGKVVLKSPLKGRRFQWPLQAKPLTAGAEYDLQLIPLDPGATPVKHPFKVSDSIPTHRGSGLILLRIN